MICSLNIINLGIIESIFIEFDKPFCSIVGETGSGKSLIIKALNLIKGAQASEHLIGPFKDSSTLQAVFKLTDPHLIEKYEQDSLIITRKIFRHKASQCFINDELVTLKKLKAVTAPLLFLSSQDEVFLISQKNFQLKLFDLFCHLEQEGVFKAYQDSFKQLLAIYEQEKNQKPLHFLSQQVKQLSESIEELSQAEVIENEEQLLREEQKLIHQKQLRLQNLQENTSSLYELEEFLQGTLNKLKTLENDATASTFFKSSETLKFEMASLLSDLKKEQHSLEMLDDSRQSAIEQRLDVLFKLAYKYQLKPGECLLAILNQLDQEKQSLEKDIAALKDLETQKKQLEQTCYELAESLHNIRKSHLENFMKQIKIFSRQLGLENMRLECDLNQKQNLQYNGFTEIQYLFSANPESSLEPLEKCSSGGEKSRILLALYSLLGKNKSKQVLVFDEIDSGISGQTAIKVGRFLANMSQENTVICVTHLEQVAEHAPQRILIEKKHLDGKTQVKAISTPQDKFLAKPLQNT